MKKALILNNEIIQVEDSPFDVHESLQWVDCGNDAKPDTHFFDGVNVVLKPAKSQAEIDAENALAAELQAIAQLKQEAKASAAFDTLRNATLVQINNFVDNNFSGLNAQARAAIKVMLAACQSYLREQN